MIFIGEKINGSRKSIQQAIRNRNQDIIKRTAFEQAEAGADYLDVNAGTSPDREADDMIWLIDVVQSVTDTPICIDSSLQEVLSVAIEHVNHTPMVNSINADPKRLESFLPIIKEKGCLVIALALDESKTGMPKTNDEKMKNIQFIMQVVSEYEIPDDKVYIDPLIMSVGTDNEAGQTAFEGIRRIREEYPMAHITGGLSNISYGLPNRALINRTFLTLAMGAGMDSAVVDPTNVGLIESMKATDMILANDRFCRNYTKASKINFIKK